MRYRKECHDIDARADISDKFQVVDPAQILHQAKARNEQERIERDLDIFVRRNGRNLPAKPRHPEHPEHPCGMVKHDRESEYGAT